MRIECKSNIQWDIFFLKNAKRAMIVSEMIKLWSKKERRKVTRGCFKDYRLANGGASHPFERNSRFLLVWRPHPRSLARIVLRGPAPLPLVASLWVAPAFCVASLYNIYSPPPNSFRAVLFRWLEEKAVACLPHPSPGPDGSIGAQQPSLLDFLISGLSRGSRERRK